MLAQILCVCFLASPFGFADEPKPARQTVERNMRFGSGGEQAIMKFDRAKTPEEQIASVRVVVNGKKLENLLPDGKKVADLRAFLTEEPEAGKNQMQVELTPTWKGLRVYELTPILKNGHEGTVTYKLRIQAGS